MPLDVPIMTNQGLTEKDANEMHFLMVFVAQTLLVATVVAYAGFEIAHYPLPQTGMLTFGMVMMDWAIVGAILGHKDGKVSLAHIVQLVLLAFGILAILLTGKLLATVLFGASLIAAAIDWKTNRRNWDRWSTIVVGMTVLLFLLAAYVSGTWAL